MVDQRDQFPVKLLLFKPYLTNHKDKFQKNCVVGPTLKGVSGIGTASELYDQVLAMLDVYHVHKSQ